ncbi:aldo/keto reductase [Streptomyces platensis]|uniref:aldo/keto reductase n=1 Tax=Streptomyces platensis TaxID=58346 RepID=UPI0036C56B0B
MHTVTLGSHGPAVGAVGLGCMGMSWAYDPSGRDEDTSAGVLRQALDLGVNLIDTADVYGPFTNEELVGKALAGRRAQAVLATKVGFVAGEQRLRRDGRPEHIRAAVDASLRRLGTDHIDLYQLHRVDPEVPLSETWGAMAETVRAGKVRMLGLSDVTAGQVRTAHEVHPVTAVQTELSLWTRDALAQLLPFTERSGIACIAYAPLGRGFLTGRFRSAQDVPEGDWRRGNPRFEDAAFAANLPMVDRIRGVAERHGASAAQIALAWVMTRGRYVVPIPGTKNPALLKENVRAAEVRLTPEDLQVLDGLPEPVGARQ